MSETTLPRLAAQAAIGAAAIELVAAWVGADATADDSPATALTRAFAAADRHCYDVLLELVAEGVPAIDPDAPPLPASLGRVCRRCGATEEDALFLPRHVAEPELCLTCGGRNAPNVDQYCLELYPGN